MWFQQKWLQAHLGKAKVRVVMSGNSIKLFLKDVWFPHQQEAWVVKWPTLRIWRAATFSLNQLKTGLVLARHHIFFSKSWPNSWDRHGEWTHSEVSGCQMTPRVLIAILFLLVFLMVTPMLFLAGKTSTLSISPNMLRSRIVFELQLLPPLFQVTFLSNLVFMTKERRVFSTTYRESEGDWSEPTW